MSTFSVVEFLLAGFTDNSGEPLSGGKVYTYEAGTTTPKVTYTDVGGATPEANPIILDSNGRKQVFADGSYKFVIKTSADVTLYTFDNLYFGTTLDFNGREATDAASATARTSLVTYGQLQDGAPEYVAIVGGSANAITLTPAIPITTYSTGQKFFFKASLSNTGSTTIAVSGLSAINIRKGAALSPIVAGDIIANAFYEITYDSANTAFILTQGTSLHVHNRTVTDINISNSTTETTIYTTTIPAGTLGLYRGLRLKMFGTHDNDTGGSVSYTWNLKLGATTIATTFNTIATDPANGWVCEAIILANASLTAQKGMIHAIMLVTKATLDGESAIGIGTAAENSATDLTLAVTMTLGTASANATFGFRGAVLEYL